MNIAPDTNILVRAITGDDAQQSRRARAILADAGGVALPLPVLCELAWVLSTGYRLPKADIASTLRVLVNAANVLTSRAAVDAGLALADKGGDFADGVIAYEGLRLGGEVFVSFDKRAVALLLAEGVAARLA